MSLQPTRPVRPVRTQWVKREQPKPQPAAPTRAQQKALRLPRPGPGIVVVVPLDCLNEFLDIYRLVPDGIQEPKNPRRDGPGEATLLVRRRREGETDGTS